MATSPDLNGDGIGEVLAGAPGWDRPSGPTLAPAPNSVGPQESVGAAYVVYGSKTPANVNVGTITGKGQPLAGGGGFRWGDQAGWNVAGLGDLSRNGVNVISVGVPGWDSNQQTPVGTGRDRGYGLLLNGVTDPVVADDLDHLADRRPEHHAGHAGDARVLLRRRSDRRLLHRDRPGQPDRQRRRAAHGHHGRRPAHRHRHRA